MDIKCRYSGLVPTGGGDGRYRPRAQDARRRPEGGGWQTTGCRIYRRKPGPASRRVCPTWNATSRTRLKYGVNVVVAVNSFSTDTPAEVEIVRKAAIEAGAMDAVVSTHWMDGGKGAVALAEAVVACRGKAQQLPIPLPVGALDQREDRNDLQRNLRRRWRGLPARSRSNRSSCTPAWALTNCRICMAKTHLSFTHDPNIKGAPTGFRISVRDIRASVGAGFLYPLLGAMRTMPGLPTRPVFYDVDLDLETGKVLGLF